MSRRLRYQVAVSLDGFIAGPNREADWIVMDPSIDFDALFKQFDTAIMGRKTYEAMSAQGQGGGMPGLDVVVFSRTLPSKSGRRMRVMNGDAATAVRAMKAQPGRDMWLFGGGSLFRSLLDAGVVDSVELAVMPVLLGSGIPLLPAGPTTALRLAETRVLPGSGIVVLSYAVPGGQAPPQISFVKEHP